MKNLTIRQRMNSSTVALVMLMLVGVAVTIWAERIRSRSSARNDELNRAKDRIFMQLVQVSDGFRGVLIWPREAREARRWQETRAAWAETVQDARQEFAAEREVVAALDQLQEFFSASLLPYYAELMKRAETDPAAALEQYASSFPSLRTKRDELFVGLERQVLAAVAVESQRAQLLAAVLGLGALGFVLVASIAVGRFQSATVAQPLQELVAAIERMRGGDFTARVQFSRRDEFGVLGDGLNHLATDLSGLVGQVQRSGLEVNRTAEQIAATAGDQQATVREIYTTTSQIGDTAQNISTTSQQLVHTLSEVNVVSTEAASLAGSGQLAINQMEATMRQIMEATGTVTARLAVLSEKTANINSVVTTITKVADQTNLLSLNAAIEAEKAGEAGLGFSVVALEIRRLADQTAVATYDIEKMVKEMQAATSAGVAGMEKFSEEVRRGAAEVRQVGAQLAQIIHQVQTLPPRFAAVNAGMNAQAAGAKLISDTLTQLAASAQRTAESLRQSQLAGGRLAEAERGLQSSVARFKLEG